MKPFICLALLCATTGSALGQFAATDEEAHRQRIAAERSRAEAEFATKQQACYARFAVNDCIHDARAERRAVLAELRRQEVVLNDAERKRRAADRVREIEARQAERPAPGVRQEPRREPSPVAPSAPAAGSAATSPPRPEAAPKPPTVSAEQAQENARRHQERVQQAQEYKARVQRKAAESAEPRRPLPVPP